MIGIGKRQTQGIDWLPLTKPALFAMAKRAHVVGGQQSSRANEGLTNLSVGRNLPLAAGCHAGIFLLLPCMSQIKRLGIITISINISRKSNQNVSWCLPKHGAFHRCRCMLCGYNPQVSCSSHCLEQDNDTSHPAVSRISSKKM